MNIFNFLFANSSCFMFIYIYDESNRYWEEKPAACYGALNEIPDFIAEKDVIAYRIDFKSESVHILY